MNLVASFVIRQRCKVIQLFLFYILPSLLHLLLSRKKNHFPFFIGAHDINMHRFLYPYGHCISLSFYWHKTNGGGRISEGISWEGGEMRRHFVCVAGAVSSLPVAPRVSVLGEVLARRGGKSFLKYCHDDVEPGRRNTLRRRRRRRRRRKKKRRIRIIIIRRRNRRQKKRRKRR